MSQLYSRGELRQKQVADNNKNGVVGNKGRTIPKIPSDSDVRPMEVNTIRYIDHET